MKRKNEEKETQIVKKVKKLNFFPDDIVYEILKFVVNLKNPLSYLLISKSCNNMTKRICELELKSGIWVLPFNRCEYYNSRKRIHYHFCLYRLYKKLRYCFMKTINLKINENSMSIDLPSINYDFYSVAEIWNGKLTIRSGFIPYVDLILKKYESEDAINLSDYLKSRKNNSNLLKDVESRVKEEAQQNDILEILIYCFNGIVTGSWLLYCLMGYPKEWDPYDINVCICSSFCLFLLKFLKLHQIQFSVLEESIYQRENYILTFLYQRVHFQIVFVNELTEECIFRKFDIDVCRSIWDGKNVYVMYDPECLINKTSDCRYDTSKDRMEKYERRGFKLISRESLDY